MLAVDEQGLEHSYLATEERYQRVRDQLPVDGHSVFIRAVVANPFPVSGRFASPRTMWDAARPATPLRSVIMTSGISDTVAAVRSARIQSYRDIVETSR